MNDKFIQTLVSLVVTLIVLSGLAVMVWIIFAFVSLAARILLFDV